MTRAEEAAMKAYPIEICGYTTECRVSAMPIPLDWNEVKRESYQEGYEQAEKDLGWISVKERLPEPSEWVVACVEVDGICTCLALTTYNEETKVWHTDNWIDGVQEVYYPDYWMPIPTKVKNDEK